MALQHMPLTEVPPRHELVRIDGNAEALSSYLQIQPPEAASTSPPILAFTRKREIQIPWGEILKDLAVTGSSSIATLRKYFEESWPFDQPVEDVLEAVSDRLITGDEPLVEEIETPAEGPPSPQLFRTTFDAEGNPQAEPLAEGVVLRHATSGRWYLVTPKPDKTLRKDDFADEGFYVKAWNEKIAGVELVFGSAEDATSVYTEFEDLDMRPVLIERKYQELSILKNYAEAVSRNVAEATKRCSRAL